jgi:hypothetical protein
MRRMIEAVIAVICLLFAVSVIVGVVVILALLALYPSDASRMWPYLRDRIEQRLELKT